MRFVLIAALKDLRRRLADPAALAIWIGMPLLLGGMISLIATDGTVTPRGKVLVVDQDDSLLSALLAGSGGQLGEQVDVEEVSLEEGRRRIDAGEATALLVLPEGFQSAVVGEASAQILLITNPAERILPGIVEEALEIVVEGVFYAQRLFGPSIRRIVSGNESAPPSDSDVASISIEINQQLSRLQGVLIPPAITLEVRAGEAQQGPALGFGQVFLPGMLFMSILFIAQGMSGDIWEEKTHGTLRRSLTTPQSAYRLLAGKLLAGMALIAVVTLIALIGTIALFGVPWMRVPLALAWCAFAGGALVALLTLLQTLATSQRGAELLSSMLVFPLMMIGGSFFPFEAMPAWMAAAGAWTPNGLAVLRLKDLLYGVPSAGALAVAALGIGIPALLAFVLAGRRLAGRFAVA